MPCKRLFVAIDLPPGITDLLLEMDPHLPGVRWLRTNDIHLTLSFLGNVGATAEDSLREKLGLVRFNAFFMPVCGVGTFPARGKPNVIWAGVGQGHPQLFHLHKRVQEAALSAGLEPELRAWHPHITLARCRDISAESVRPFLKQRADFDAGLVRVESFCLYSSVPGPRGSVYTGELQVSAA